MTTTVTKTHRAQQGNAWGSVTVTDGVAMTGALAIGGSSYQLGIKSISDIEDLMAVLAEMYAAVVKPS